MFALLWTDCDSKSKRPSITISWGSVKISSSRRLRQFLASSRPGRSRAIVTPTPCNLSHIPHHVVFRRQIRDRYGPVWRADNEFLRLGSLFQDGRQRWTNTSVEFPKATLYLAH